VGSVEGTGDEASSGPVIIVGVEVGSGRGVALGAKVAVCVAVGASARI
jgi:hypothetical protein